MIVKKVKRSKSDQKIRGIRSLADYIRSPSQTHSREKVLYSNGRGFLCEGPSAQREEMVALATESVRSKSPVNHYVLSWREGEQPSPGQVEEAVSIFLEELGWKDHQAIYALHKDTDNVHLHIAVNRVHPDTHKVVEINRGFDIEMSHKAIARIEQTQGWQREKNGRYQVLENGELARSSEDIGKQRQPNQKKRDMENRTGEKSATRIAIEEGASIIKEAKTWEDLHERLAAKGMKYEKTGSGATVFVGDIGVKASDVDRNASLSKMEKRLGEYRKSSQREFKYEREPESIKAEFSGWKEYIIGRKEHYSKKTASKIELDRRQEEERSLLKEKHKVIREELLKGNWRNKGDLLNAMRSVIGSEQASEVADLNDRHTIERDQWRETYRPYPDFEQWQRHRDNPDLADQWRFKNSDPQIFEGHFHEGPKLRDIRGYRPEIVGGSVHYLRKEREASEGGVSFVDYGNKIEVHEVQNRDCVLASLQLSQQKWGSFKVHGNDDFKAMCVKLAAEHGFEIINLELKDLINKERLRIQEERERVMKADQFKDFERYAEAVGADKFRVTSIKMSADGSKQTFILDKREGVSKGFTREEIGLRTSEMLRLQNRGENLYYTPLSESKHHILVDDMNRGKLEKFIKDGFKPAVLIESSPGNYQAIITVAKLGTEHDKEVGNRLGSELNRRYGDPKLSGSVHPHRAPGFQNRKPKHVDSEGRYPEVKLIKAERRECALTLSLAKEMDLECQKAKTVAGVGKNVVKERFLEGVQDGAKAIEAYKAHYKDVVRRLEGREIDLSRIDSMIAVRMRVTGHEKERIEGAILHCAPLIRDKQEGRDWKDYAQRTAKYAFSISAEKQTVALGRYRSQWMVLENKVGSTLTKTVEVKRERKMDRGLGL